MAKLLDMYIQRRDELNELVCAGKLPQEKLIELPELNYRIEVMETCRTFCRTAPVTKDMRELGFHYQLVNAYIRGLQTERKFGLRTDENGTKRRQTAEASVKSVVEEYQKKFSSFKVTADDQYKKCIGGIINTVLMVWIQYRDAYISIK